MNRRPYASPVYLVYTIVSNRLPIAIFFWLIRAIIPPRSDINEGRIVPVLRNLHDSIVDYDMNMLRAVARARGFELEATRQAAAVDELKAYLLDADAMTWALSRLTEDSRAALHTLLQAGGQMKAHIFFDHFGKPRAFGPGRLDRERPWLTPENPAEHLWFMGLLYTTFHDVGEGYRAQFVYVPSDLAPLLPEVEIVVPRFEVTPADPPARVHSQGMGLLADLFHLLVRLQVRPLSIDSDHHELARELLTADFGPSEPSDYLDFLLHLAREADLLRDAGRRLRLNPESARQWLKWPSERQLYHLQTVWRADAVWDELRHIPELVIEETGWKNDPVRARRAVLGHLGRCPTDVCPLDTWLSVESLLEAVKRVDPDFARPDGDYRSWYIRDAATGEYLMDFACWNYVEARLIVSLLTGPLFWLGAVDLGYEGDVFTAFRLVLPGYVLLDKAGPPPAVEALPSTATIHPDFTVRFEPGARLYEQFQAARFTQRVSETSEGETYRITRSALSAALAQGISPQMILAFLRKLSVKPLPANVVDALRKWRPK